MKKLIFTIIGISSLIALNFAFAAQERTVPLLVGSTPSTPNYSMPGTLTVAGAVTLPNVAANAFLATDASHNIIATTTPSGGGGGGGGTGSFQKFAYDNSASSTDDIPLYYAPQAFTITEIDCVNDNFAGNTVSFNVYAASTRTGTTTKVFASNQTCTATSTPMVLTSFASSSIPTSSFVHYVFSSASTTGVTIGFQSNTTLSTTTKSNYDILAQTSDDVFLHYTAAAETMKQVDCVNDAAAGNTFTFNVYWGTTRSATTSAAFTSNQTCSSTASMTNLTPNGSTTIPAGSIVHAVYSSASTTGGYIDYQF